MEIQYSEGLPRAVLDTEKDRLYFDTSGDYYDELAEFYAGYMAAEEAAAGVFEIAAANQVHGIRQVTVMKGRDPSAFALVAFGGAGGLFAAEVADTDTTAARKKSLFMSATCF